MKPERKRMKPEKKAKQGEVWRNASGREVVILEDDIHGSVINRILYRSRMSGCKGSMKESRFYQLYEVVDVQEPAGAGQMD